MNLQTKTLKALNNSNIELSELHTMSAEELLAIKGIGPKLLVEIQDYITATQHIAELESKADRRAKHILREKSTTVAQLAAYWIETKEDNNELIKSLLPKGYMEDIQNNKDSKKRIYNQTLSEYMLLSFLALDLETQAQIISPLLNGIFMHQVRTGESDVIGASLVSQAALPIQDIVRLHFASSWSFKRSITNIVTDTVSKYYLLAQILLELLLEVLSKMRILDKHMSFTQEGHRIYKFSIISTEAKLDKVQDINLIKHLTKTVGTQMDVYPQQYKDSTRLPDGTSLYCGHSMKFNAGTQHKSVIDVINTKQSTGYTINKYLSDPSHELGKQFLALIYKQLDNESSRQQLSKLLVEYSGETLFTTVSIIPDNGRIVYNGYPIGLHVGAISWILEYEDKELITDASADNLRARVIDLESKAKLKPKEACEMLSYKAALLDYEAGIPSGCMTSNDFVASGPMMQAIMNKDAEGLKASMTYDGVSPSDPYRIVLNQMIEDGVMDAHITELLIDHTMEQTMHVLRDWVKNAMQPLQYGSGANTAMSKAIEAGAKFSFEEFDKAFTEALPNNHRLLQTLKYWARQLSKEIKSSPKSDSYHKLSFMSTFGTRCTITPLSDKFENKFSLLNHRNITVPCKIVDIEQYSVKLVAAASHQLDSSLLMMINSLYGRNLTDVHDDFRPHVNHEPRLHDCAIQAVKLLWEQPNILNNYLGQVLAPLQTGSFIPYCDLSEPGQIDWSKVNKVLH